MGNAVVINAHQRYKGFAERNLNQHFANAIEDTLKANSFEVCVSEIDKGYTTENAIRTHEWAKVIILQTPTYWFGTPWVFKKYLDEVFTQAMTENRIAKDDGRSREDPSKQYGTGGLLTGKQFMISTTMDAPRMHVMIQINTY